MIKRAVNKGILISQGRNMTETFLLVLTSELLMIKRCCNEDE